jgi:hypothetical protein
LEELLQVMYLILVPLILNLILITNELRYFKYYYDMKTSPVLWYDILCTIYDMTLRHPCTIYDTLCTIYDMTLCTIYDMTPSVLSMIWKYWYCLIILLFSILRDMLLALWN